MSGFENGFLLRKQLKLKSCWVTHALVKRENNVDNFMIYMEI